MDRETPRTAPPPPSGPGRDRDLDRLCIDTLRFLAVDAVERAASGHPGMPMGAAPMAYVLWTRHLTASPERPLWWDRDRFVLSAGHGSMLLYGLLHLSGYDLSMEDLRRFRQLGSHTPGHPERDPERGVEVTTGPLGQGLGNGVGLAIAEAHLAARYNRPGHAVVDHRTWVIASDGDFMEGLSSEAAGLAGHLGLGKLTVLYDANQVSLAAGTAVSFTEDVAARLAAQGWHTQHVADGTDLDALDGALQAARDEAGRPSLIVVRTQIGYGAPNKQGTFGVHGSPLGADEVQAAKANLGWPAEPTFHVPDAARARFRERVLERGRQAEARWRERWAAYERACPAAAAELARRMEGRLPEGWEEALPTFEASAKGVKTRVAGGQVLNALAQRLPELMGGSADLNPSTHTALEGEGDFQRAEVRPEDLQGSSGGPWSHAGRNLHFGVREHAMGAAAVGLAAHGGILPYTATFLTFSDYMRPPMRLAALGGLPALFVFTHDSLGLGEDGPTHQPVEHLAGLRALPGLQVIRPGDANETAEAFRLAITTRDRPSAIVLTRQDVPTLDRSVLAPAAGLLRGGYVLAEAGDGRPWLVLIATGSEVPLIVAAREELERRGVPTRAVSLPCWERFAAAPSAYRDEVLPPGVPARLAVEAGASLGWHRWAGDRGDVLAVDRFGASGPPDEVLAAYGFRVEAVVERALHVLERSERA